MTVQLFKQLPYQAVAAEAVVDCFDGQPRIEGLSYQIDPGRGAASQLALLGEVGFKNADLQLNLAQLRTNIRAVQTRQHLPPSDLLASSKAAPINLDIEMETGTGKTYVYIDTMYRLYQRYGWSKFIIVVPSVAIREGVFQTFADTEAHFQERYGHKVRRFIYDSSRPEPILAFSDSPGLHCMVINTQAFASEVSAAGKEKESKTLRMFREMDQFGSRKPIDLIAANRPIVILDEPQRLEGTATQNALALFRAPIALRYSATHKTRHDLVHRLDALDAYNRKLVKRISVRGVTVKGLPGISGYLYLSNIRVSAGAPPVARVMIETVLQGGKVQRKPAWLKKGDDLEDRSGGLAEYRGYTVSDIDALAGTLSFTNGIVLEEGRVTGDTSETAVRRVQIRETIRAHFARERLLNPRGIKVLSLFFIDEVAKYRRYGAEGEAVPGEYAEMFEEEYAAAVADLGLLDASDAAWHAYVKRDAAGAVHQGYFSIDKAGRMVDPAIAGRGEEKGEAKDASSYDLILRNKARLLSLDEPVRFIFSHSALREGWDNPNVFTICTLKQSDHEIGKRQEVGRGLRISVDDLGRRTDGPEVHDINVLTVIASESYEDFAKGLQSEMVEALKGRPREASVAYFTGMTVATDTGGREVTREEASELEFWLIQNGYVDIRRHITPKWHEAKEAGALVPLPEALAPNSPGFVTLVDTIFDDSLLKRLVGNDRKTVTPQVRRANLDKRAFQELWSRINEQAVYFTDFDTELLIERTVRRLDRDLKVDAQVIVVSGANLQTGLGVEELRKGKGFAEERTSYEHAPGAVDSKVRYDLVGELAKQTRLTRATAGRILQGISPKTFALFGRNPEMFLRKAADLVRREKVALAIESLRYEKTGTRYDVSIFETDRREIPLDAALATARHVHDYVAVDSANERSFAERLEAAEEVVVYAKLPRGFVIPTPGGGYNPDWAIAFDFKGERQIYFVAETKGSMLDEDLRAVEQQNIDSAEAYFRDIADKVTFRKIDRYDVLMQAIT